MKKKITLSARQITLLLLVNQLYGLPAMVEITLNKIRENYPGGIPADCEEMFSFEIPIKQIGRFFNTLSKAAKHDQTKDHWDELSILKTDLKNLLDHADQQHYIFKVVAVLGKPVLSPALIEALTSKGVYLVHIDTPDDVQKFIFLHKPDDGYVEFEFLIITDGNSTEPAFVSQVFDLLNPISEEPVGVYQLGGPIHRQLNEIVDFIIVDEKDIDWHDLHINLTLEK